MSTNTRHTTRYQNVTQTKRECSPSYRVVDTPSATARRLQGLMNRQHHAAGVVYATTCAAFT